jgi:nitrite reductase/ring-hydroxylating ferredoxin subunit
VPDADRKTRWLWVSVVPGDLLRCLGHHYEYDLRTGICRTGGDLTLRTRLVG